MPGIDKNQKNGNSTHPAMHKKYKQQLSAKKKTLHSTARRNQKVGEHTNV